MNILDIFAKQKQTKDYLSYIKDNPSFSLNVYNSCKNVNYLLTYLAYKETEENIIYIARNVYFATKAYDAFCELAGYENVSFYAIDEIAAVEVLAYSWEFRLERINTIKNIILKKKKIIVTHIQAALRYNSNKEKFLENSYFLKTNDTIELKEFFKSLVKSGYKRTPITEEVGDFSVRGGVIDIFPFDCVNPIRLDLFGNEIENIRIFDKLTQRSISKVDSVEIFPLNDTLYEEEKIDKLIQELEVKSKDDLIDLKEYNNVERANKYIKYLDDAPQSIVDYLDSKIIVFDEYNVLKDNQKISIENIDTFFEEKVFDLEYYYQIEYLINNNKVMFLSEHLSSLNNIKLSKTLDFESYEVASYQNNLKVFLEELKINKNKKYLIALNDEKQIILMKDILENASIEYSLKFNLKEKVNVLVLDNPISFGLISNIEVITTKELFATKYKSKIKYRSSAFKTDKLYSKEDLNINDFVVHQDYGIARYLGLSTQETKGIKNDYLHLEFQDGALYIPVSNIHLLEKYIASESAKPKLSSLNSKEWIKKKEKIKDKLKDIAEDLITMQALRDQNLGVKYLKDDPLQEAFENDFEFEETLDQLETVKEIKLDMESGKIVDRLVCGDVGYGKTEIAMRIAFKTVYNSKQVAYLAPTTILSRQHYYTFKERFSKYGVKVALLNRLVDSKTQTEVLKKLKEGKIDVLIGTHRILSDDIHFKDLGLLIIDEEQRFGVIHKEKIKKIKTNVNVLTLTATPIPRTLQMATMGLRQLSLITTPPLNRYPIQTYVLPKNDVVVKEAIYRELSRNGQIFYLCNRIASLDRTKNYINKLVKEARVGIVHGQLSKEAIEDVVQSFIDKEYDVLLCTTIIETGIDISNANTLIIENVDNLGLAQLYQIRGRVGRTDKIAYAYLMYETGKVLTSEATQRLMAIKEFTSLGSGFNIASRDLAIRGAGDVLGQEQSGYIDSVGMDLYMKILNEAIKEAKHEEIEKEEIKTYNINISKHVDKNYVSDDDVKIFIHKAINSINSLEEKNNLINLLTDRFGEITETIKLYIEEEYLQSLLKRYEIKNFEERKDKVSFSFSPNISDKIDGSLMFIIANSIDKNIRFNYRSRHIMVEMPKGKSWVYMLVKFLEKIKFKN